MVNQAEDDVKVFFTMLCFAFVNYFFNITSNIFAIVSPHPYSGQVNVLILLQEHCRLVCRYDLSPRFLSMG